MIFKLTAIFTLLCSLSVWSSNAPKPDKSLFFNNVNCVKNNSCGLTSFGIKVFHDKTGNDTYMEGFYETKNQDQLEKYIIVQYIKGCVYETTLINDEIRSKRYGMRTYFGENGTNFVHKNWEVDSIDYDPAYASLFDQDSRHGAYKYLLNPAKSTIYDSPTYYKYYLHQPVMKSSRLYFSDMPTGGNIRKPIYPRAGADEGKKLQSYTNSSLRFKTCVFETTDVDINGGKDGVDIKKAIHCFDWRSSHIYNDQTETFDSPEKIDPICLK